MSGIAGAQNGRCGWAILSLSLLSMASSGGCSTADQTRVLQPNSDGEKTLTLDLGGGVTLEMVRIPAGTFMMGSPDGEEGVRT